MASHRAVPLRSKRKNRESESIISPVYCRFLTGGVSYFIVKGVSRDAIHMPPHYYPDDTVRNGKEWQKSIPIPSGTR